MKKKFWFSSVSAVVLSAGVGLAFSLTAYAAQIPEGLYAGGRSLGGMTAEEAEQTVSEYIESMAGQKITLEVAGQSVETTAEELGFHWSNPEAVTEAVKEYTSGNIIKRFLSKKRLENQNVDIPLETKVDDEKTGAFVEEKCSGLTAAPQDATITRQNGQFIITPEVVGVTVDLEATKNALNAAFQKGLDSPVSVTAVVTESRPAVTAQDLSTIQDVLGTFTTGFSSSGAARSKNLSVGAGKINGHVLMPGQTLSGYECMAPFTTKNGYATAAAYENGMVVDSVGGGVCQIATTLYNAALRAEMEITQRQNHSMVVNYVDHSADAAIAGTYKDIKITNNYSTPLYVEGYTEGKKLTFTIYGKETRPANRKVSYVSETLKVMNPGEPITNVDNSLAPGARVRVQGAHTGIKSRLWKVVTVDGVETERTLLHTDTYNPSKAVYRVGPAAPVSVPEVVETAPVETAPPQPMEGVNGGPGVTAPPAAEAPAAPGPGEGG